MVTRKLNKKKNFWVVAYDIVDDHRRLRIVKIIEKYGVRVNYSVFECMLTDRQVEKLQENIAKLILPSEDVVVCYPLCLECYSKIVYYSNRKMSSSVVMTV